LVLQGHRLGFELVPRQGEILGSFVFLQEILEETESILQRIAHAVGGGPQFRKRHLQKTGTQRGTQAFEVM
jgi:hypothetical protein